MEIFIAHLAANYFDSFQLEIKNRLVHNISVSAAVSKHGIWFKRLVILATGEVSVFIGLKVGGAVDYRAIAKTKSEFGQVVGEFLDKFPGFFVVNGFFGMDADLGHHKLGPQKPDTIRVSLGDTGGQVRFA